MHVSINKVYKKDPLKETHNYVQAKLMHNEAQINNQTFTTKSVIMWT